MPQQDRVLAVVTGATDGIGLAAAEALAKQGAELCLVARRQAGLSRAAECLARLGAPAPTLVVADLADNEGLDKTVIAIRAAADRHNGRLDVLVNNAATGRFMPFADVRSEDFSYQINLNLRTPFFLTQALVPQLAAARGAIVNISSYFADKMIPGRPSSVYSATKGALNALTKALAYELGPQAIRVNAIAPGSVETATFSANQERLGEAGRSAFWQFVKQHYPLEGRIGSPDEIGAVVAFLAGPDARWITGQVLHVDGGLTTT